MIAANSDSTQKRLLSIAFVALRILIGWHLLYEGMVKLFSPDWSAAEFLLSSKWILSGFFHWIAQNDALLEITNFINIWGLTLIGLALFIGFFTRIAAISGAALLLLYYIANPPFMVSPGAIHEGNYFIIDKNLIEICALLLIATFRAKKYLSLDAFLSKIFSKKEGNNETQFDRRQALKNLATLPLLGVFGAGAFNKNNIEKVNATSGATIKVSTSSLKDLKGELPKGKIQHHEISRLVMGGNLIGGWAHARDLKYVSSLFKAYNTEKKIFDTLQLAEQAGINTINIGFPTNKLMEKYKKITGSKIKVISQVAPDRKNMDYFGRINEALDCGTDIIQIQGNVVDWMVRDKQFFIIEEMLEYIRKQNITAGLASHTVDALIECEKRNIIPDYYMKTMHHDNYWSAHPIENRQPYEVDGKRSNDHNRFHDNCFCLFPDKTVEFVQNAKVPVMGFKVLAAGAIKPEDGFNWAFKNGADFICVGMFDFQVIDDINTTIDVLNKLQGRTRNWYG